MVAHKVHGIAVLGLASEVHRLSSFERQQLMEWVIEDADGAVPVAVTVAEPNQDGQITFCRSAQRAGASWLVLQPPPVKAVPESALIRYFGAIADTAEIPVAIQNAPEYLGIGLSNDAVGKLNSSHPNVSMIKLEATATSVKRLHDAVGDRMDIFNGRAGIDLINSIDAGAVGIIPGGESFDVLTRIFNDLVSPTGQRDRAEKTYRDILPLLMFLMESLDHFLVHGKAVLGYRLGLDDNRPRPPYAEPCAFSRQIALRHAIALGKL